MIYRQNSLQTIAGFLRTLSQARLCCGAALLLLSAALTPAFSQELTDHKPGKWWKASLVALAGATVADAASSWNRIEANPVLRGSDGRFGARGLGFKLGIAGTVAFTQYMLAKRGPQAERVAVFANFAAAGAFGAAAVHNWSRNSARPAMPSYLAR